MAGEPAAAGEPRPAEKGEVGEDIIETERAGTQRKYELEFSVSPRVEDAVDRDFVRMPLRIKYGISANWEASLTLGFFFENPFMQEETSGMSHIVVGTKYLWKKALKPHVRTATSFSVLVPAADNEEITDGYTHYQPRIIFTRTLTRMRRVELSASVGMDFLSGSSNSGEEKENSLSLTSGALYPAPPLSYFFEAVWTTTGSGGRNSFFLTPGLRWDIRPRTQNTVLKGAESLSIGARFGLDAADDEFTLVARFKYDFPLKVKFRKAPPGQRPVPPPAAPARDGRGDAPEAGLSRGD